MADYRLYLLDGHGRIDRALPLVFDSDEQAVETVVAYPHLHGMELWQLERFVRRFDASPRPAETPPNPAGRALFQADPRP